ncbi:cell division protein FtsQ/DivIB [Oceanibacterium hippocampi]|uniref:Cell division protein FtsQ n=1 Tax=Oceanibacterium hippocampi TaxID=745714 RepID=A0A1Y5SC30_9PROT|nr:FtsQ-type POTRA domain-containing protein [Oceanibacterium hippocampi]SLN37342.1 Cell division protein FtsQ [Oceanibacterium hippocampi]
MRSLMAMITGRSATGRGTRGKTSAGSGTRAGRKPKTRAVPVRAEPKLRVAKPAAPNAPRKVPTATKRDNRRTPTRRGSGKRPAPRWLAPTLVAASVLVVAGGVAGGGYLLYQGGYVDRMGAAANDTLRAGMMRAGLVLRDVTVEGRRRTDADDILRAVGVARGDPIFDIDPYEIRQRIERLGWVRSASVERRLPDSVHIRLEERRPFARWQHEGQTVLISRDGSVIVKSDPAEFRFLPRVVGGGAEAVAAKLFDQLAEKPELFARVRNAIRVRDRRWDLQLDNGIIVKLPEDGMKEAWLRLALLEADDAILARDLLAIDLRVPGRVFVRLTPDAAAVRRQPGKDT